MNAKQCLNRFVIQFLEDSEKYKTGGFRGCTFESVMKDLKNKNDDSRALEWVLGEFLDNEFSEAGIIEKKEWDQEETVHTTIYKIGNKFIREQFSRYMEDHNFDFVKLKKKKIVVFEYEVVSSKKK